jgi:hypothetical protein
MPTPGEHKTFQARILEYAEVIGWTIVSREEAEQRRGIDPDMPHADRARNQSLFFDDLLDAKVREFKPRYAEAKGSWANSAISTPTSTVSGTSSSPYATGASFSTTRKSANAIGS